MGHNPESSEEFEEESEEERCPRSDRDKLKSDIDRGLVRGQRIDMLNRELQRKNFDGFVRMIASAKTTKELDAAFDYLVSNRCKLGEGYLREGFMIIFAKNPDRYLNEIIGGFITCPWLGEVLWSSLRKNSFNILKMLSTRQEVPSVRSFLYRVAENYPKAILIYNAVLNYDRGSGKRAIYSGYYSLNPGIEEVARESLAGKQGKTLKQVDEDERVEYRAGSRRYAEKKARKARIAAAKKYGNLKVTPARGANIIVAGKRKQPKFEVAERAKKYR